MLVSCDLDFVHVCVQTALVHTNMSRLCDDARFSRDDEINEQRSVAYFRNWLKVPTHVCCCPAVLLCENHSTMLHARSRCDCCTGWGSVSYRLARRVMNTSCLMLSCSFSVFHISTLRCAYFACKQKFFTCNASARSGLYNVF